MGLFLYLDKYFLTSKIKIKRSVSDMIVKSAGPCSLEYFGDLVQREFIFFSSLLPPSLPSYSLALSFPCFFIPLSLSVSLSFLLSSPIYSHFLFLLLFLPHLYYLHWPSSFKIMEGRALSYIYLHKLRQILVIKLISEVHVLDSSWERMPGGKIM